MSALYGTYARSGLAFERGEGVRLYAQDGEEYLDFHSGIGVNALGHGDPHLVSTLKAAAEKVWHTSNVFSIPEQERLGQRLVDSTFADSVFFTNSGAEAVECAIKTARHYFWAKGQTEKYEIIAFTGSFHGRTLGTIAAGGNEHYIEGFGPPLAGFRHLAPGDLKAVEALIDDKTCAILLEPVQGEGGVTAMPVEFLKGLRALCDKHDMLLIFDEVQCGYGRTGRFFAYEWTGIEPDIMAVAKGIGGGFPLGACLAKGPVAASMVPGTHGSTYGGNPLACAVGVRVMQIIAQPEFLAGVNRKGALLRQKLEGLIAAHPGVFEAVRGQGLMLGLKCKVAPADLVNAGYAEHLLTVGAADNTVRLLPPLNISDEEIAEAVARLDRAAGRLDG